MFEIHNALDYDYSDVINKGSNDVTHFSVFIHTRKSNIPVIVISIDTKCDYINNKADVKFVTVKLPLGTMIIDILPYIHNLELTIISTGSFEEETRYKAIFPKSKQFYYQVESLTRKGKEELDLMDYPTVTFQIVPLYVEVLRLPKVGGVFKGNTREEVVTSVLGAVAKDNKTRSVTSLDILDIYPFDNKEVIDQMIIPSNTPYMGLVDFIHRQERGIYLNGCNAYAQVYKGKNSLFVYPPFNYSKSGTDKHKLSLYELPSGALSDITETYYTEGNVTKVLVTKPKDDYDINEGSDTNTSVGLVVTNTDLLESNPVTPTASGLKVVNNTTQFVHVHKEDGVDNINVSSNPVTSNVYREISDRSPHIGRRIDVVWNNANPSLIYPGMNIVYHLEKNSEIERLEGVIIHTHVMTSTELTPELNNPLQTAVVISLFVQSYNT